VAAQLSVACIEREETIIARSHATLGIPALLVLHVGMAAICTPSVYVASSSTRDGTLKPPNTSCRTFRYFTPSKSRRLTCRSARLQGGTRNTSRAVGTVKFKAVSEHGDLRTLTLDSVHLVSQQQHNLVAVCQLNHCAKNA